MQGKPSQPREVVSAKKLTALGSLGKGGRNFIGLEDKKLSL